MYDISVPVINHKVTLYGCEETLKQLRRFDARRVVLALNRYETDPAARRQTLKELKDNCRFFKEHGYEVAAWTWTFWMNDTGSYTTMTPLDGSETTDYVCPLDQDFVRFAAGYLRDLAACGVDLILFDDDFRYGFLCKSQACVCKNHLALIGKLAGRTVTREEVGQAVRNGGKNELRDAFLQANGDAFRGFAKAMRAAVDEVNPRVRLGACTCMSSWDLDNADPWELSHLLAGSTKPFARLIGAPYWATARGWGNELQDVIELERMECAWTRQGEIEIIAEGDAYPRPRTACPASYLECFDTALRASGVLNGILKYGMDYHSHPNYETGYAVFHEKNRPLYAQIDRVFGQKESVGVRVYEAQRKIADTVVPTAVNGSYDPSDLFFSRAARLLAYNSIPTVYEGSGVCGAVFVENARHLPLDVCKNGLILDIAAAEILQTRGVDTGVLSIGKPVDNAEEEHFLSDDNRISASGVTFFDLTLASNAEVLSVAESPTGTVPASFRYENAAKERFLVLNVRTRGESPCNFRHYARGRQLAETSQWLGKKLPAYVYGNPALYIQAKTGDGAMAVGLWNLFADPALAPVVELDKPYAHIGFINCTGRLNGDRVILSDLPPFSFAGFEVK